MKARCFNKNSSSYPDYGARGITVCTRWRDSFENFLEDMGERPAGKTLDRYPNQLGNYEPGNCRWATPKEQVANSRRPDFSRNKERLIGKQFGLLTVVGFDSVGRNSHYMWKCVCACGTTKVMHLNGRKKSCGCERAQKLVTSNKERFAAKQIEYAGERLSQDAWARKLGITSAAIRWRLKRWPISRALSAGPGAVKP